MKTETFVEERERERERERGDMYMIFGGTFDKFIWFLIGGRF
jgi:hypothetical protein